MTVGPKEQKDFPIALLKAQSDADLRGVGAGTMWVLEADDRQQTYEQLRARGVRFLSRPEQVPWGISAVCEDLYGNPFKPVQPRQGRPVLLQDAAEPARTYQSRSTGAHELRRERSR